MLPISNLQEPLFGTATFDKQGRLTSLNDDMRALIRDCLLDENAVMSFPFLQGNVDSFRQWLAKPQQPYERICQDGSISYEVLAVKTSESEFLMLAKNITEKVVAKRQLELLATAVEQAWESVCITDADLEAPGPRFIYCNLGFTKLTGYTETEVLGLNPRILQGPLTDKSILATLKNNLKNGEDFHGATVNYRKDGSPFWLEWKIYPVKDSNNVVTNFIAFQRDVTELQEARNNLQEVQSIMAHEMRSPLTSVSGALSLLRGEVEGNELAKELVDIAASTTKNLVQLINDLLELRQIENNAPELNVEQIKAISAIDDAASVMKMYRQDVHIRNACPSNELTVVADAGRLRQVLVNLLSNAMKYSPPDGTVTVKSYLAPNGQNIRFSVSDEGPGMTEESIAKLFGCFSQVSAADGTAREGTGLGLAISKALVEAHGGRMAIESKPGKGTTCWFELPATGQATQSDPQSLRA